MHGALTLTDKGYKAKPLCRVYIEKPGKKKKRPLSIPCMYDRTMQALYALALDPVSEITADTKSFGFRKVRCAQDACEYKFTALSRGFSPEWVLEGNIKGCFDLSKKGKYSAFVHNKSQVNLVRYADDFIVTTATKEIAEEAKVIIRNFLQTRGLEFSEEKTVITHIDNGFDMLGWTFRKFQRGMKYLSG